MMGHRGTNSGGEVDTLVNGWRRLYHWKAGTRRWWKRKFNKRMRHQGEQECRTLWCDGVPERQREEVMRALEGQW